MARTGFIRRENVMNRLMFEKTGNAVYISHLDTMALFPRVFLRAGLHVQFTQGMSPHAYVSIAMPLSVGMSSSCELLDFALKEENVPLEELPGRLNPFFPSGIRVLKAYDSPRKAKEIRHLRFRTMMEYDNGIPEDAVSSLDNLFSKETLIVEKKTKKGLSETDIRPMIQSVSFHPVSEKELALEALVCAVEPSLNPQYLIHAINRYTPELMPDFAATHRLEIYDKDMNIFR